MHALDFITSQYEKIRLLKQTERSAVWLAAAPQGQLVILKHLRQTGLPLRPLKEAQIPLLPQLYYITETKSETITSEEYITGTSLAQYRQEGRFLTPLEAEKILLALCDGLAAIHALGIIHRDIKPAHILIEKDGTPRLIDFDTCRLLKDNQREDTELLGTKNYAPPEQFGFQQTDCRSDIYALGQTINELLPPDYQGKLRSIVKRCQRLDPADRYQSMQELKTAIKRPTLNKRIALLLILPVLALLAYLYPVQQPSTELTPPAATEESNDSPPTNTTTNQPQESANTAPTATNATPPAPTPSNITVPAPVPPDNQQNKPTETTTNYIRTQYFRYGHRLEGWMENFDTPINNGSTLLELHRSFWEQARDDQGIIHMPADDIVTLRIINRSPEPWHNAHVTLHYDSHGYTDTQSLTINTLAPGESTDVNIPLANYPIINPEKATNVTIGELSIEVSSDSPQEICSSRYRITFSYAP